MVEYNIIANIINKIINEQTNKCHHNWQEFIYSNKNGQKQTIKYEELKQRPNFIDTVAKAYDDYLKKGKF